MGVLRLLLAMAVSFEHLATSSTSPFLWFGGRIAVVIFFIISGFYMGLIYTTKYSQCKNGLMLFYSNRALRIYPVYFFVLFLSSWSAGSFFGSEFWHFPEILIPFANLLIFGSDAVVMAGYVSSFSPLTLYVAQVWSIAVELTFYLMVPFIVKRTFVITALIAASISLRVYFGVNGYGELPFLYYFFPSILVFFLAGYLGFCIYSRVKDYTVSRYIGVGGIVFFFSYIAYKTYIYGGFFLAFFDPHLGGPHAHLLFAAFALYIPFLFLVTKDSKVDRFIGGLSYSYFLSHLFGFKLVADYLLPYLEHNLVNIYLAKIMASLALSVFIYLIIEKPIDSFREKRVENTLKKTVSR